MDEHRAAAQALLRKAQDDQDAAVRLAEPPPASLWMIGFHAQQCVEKAVKAVLVRHDVAYPFTHDIAALIGLVRRAGLPLPPESGHLSTLTPFGTQFRYENEELELPSAIDASRMLQWGTAALDWANACIEHQRR